jgi:hypothetical protein
MLKTIQLKLKKHEIFTYKAIKKNYVYCMQRRKYMAQILIFFYVLVISLSLFIVVTSINMSFYIEFLSPCKTDDDCLEKLYYFSRCIDNQCEYFRLNLQR